MVTSPDVAPSRQRPGRVRALVTTTLDIGALIAVPWGAGLVAGLGVGLIVGGLCLALASWGISRGGAE